MPILSKKDLDKQMVLDSLKTKLLEIKEVLSQTYLPEDRRRELQAHRQELEAQIKPLASITSINTLSTKTIQKEN